MSELNERALELEKLTPVKIADMVQNSLNRTAKSLDILIRFIGSNQITYGFDAIFIEPGNIILI